MTAAAIGAALPGTSSAWASPVSSSDWLGEINYYRSGSGLPPVTANSSWTQGIENHLVYLANTPQSYYTGQYQSLHTENPSSPYYTQSGAQEASRSDLFEGAVGYTPKQFIDGWLTAPFHAIGMLRPGLQQVAFASNSSTGDAGLDVISGLNSSQSRPSQPILFPGNGSSTDLWAFGGEAPNPLQTCGWQGAGSVGLPLIALLPSPPSSSLTATLTSGNGATESTSAGTLCVVDSHTYQSSDPVYGPTGAAILSGDNAVLLIPKSPLTYGSYSVDVEQPGAAAISWSFQETQPQVLEAESGQGQSTSVNHSFPQALAVRTSNGTGFTETGVPVQFTIAAGAASFADGSTTATARSGPNGVATIPEIEAGATAGSVTVVATSPGAAPLTFHLTVDIAKPVCSQTLPSGTVVGMASTADGGGYWIVNRFGQVAACGDAPDFGNAPYSGDPITAIATSPRGDGYWLATAGGSVYSFGTAAYHGGIPAGVNLRSGIVGMAADPATGGYWLLGGDGGVFSFDAPFYGSTGNIQLNRPAVGMAATPDGNGYYFVAADGGIFAYGDAPFYGSTGGLPLNQPVVGMALDPATGGYWMDAADGGIFSFHAPFYGSTGNVHLAQPCVGMTVTPGGNGYRFVAADGGIFDFGAASFQGSAVG